MGQVHSHDVSSFRKDLTKCIDQVKGVGDTIVIKKYDKPFAVLVPFSKRATSPDNSIECPAGTIRNEIGEILNQIYYNHIHYIITRHKLPVVVLRPLEDGDER